MTFLIVTTIVTLILTNTVSAYLFRRATVNHESRAGRQQDEIIKLRRIADMTVRVKANDVDILRATVEELYYTSVYGGKLPGEQYSLFIPEGMSNYKVQLMRPDESTFFDVTIERPAR